MFSELQLEQVVNLFAISINQNKRTKPLLFEFIQSKNLKVSFTILFSIFITIVVAQNIQPQKIQGYIVTQDNVPIEFCTIALSRHATGAYSNKLGFFEINSGFTESDTLVFSHLGYETLKYSVSEYLSKRMDTIVLLQNTYQFQEIVVKPKKYKLISIKTENRAAHFYSGRLGTVLVFHLKGHSGGILNEVEFFFKKQKDFEAFVMLRVLAVHEDALLDEDNLLDTSVVVKIPVKAKSISIKLDQLHITIPDEGLYLGLEFLGNPNIKKDPNDPRSNPFGPKLMLTAKRQNGYTFVSEWGRKWTNYTRGSEALGLGSVNLKLSYKVLVEK